MDPVTSGGGAAAAYPDSVESSPRSRGGESWDEPFPSSAAPPSKLRLMCSYGGRIVPRPTDRSLCYLGGETRMVVVERHSTLADLSSRLARSLLGGRSFTLKYQLPNEDLDSLISVTTDEDLENMIEEFDRVAAAGGGGGGGGSSRSNRVRLFLFPSKPDSASSSVSSLLDDSKSETWFVDALNGAIGMGSIDGMPRGLSTDSASVNCLLGLEDDSSVHSRGGGGAPAAATAAGEHLLPRPDSSGKIARQDVVHSVPDSPMLDTSSSFGSTSSAPSLSNLPPIRVRADDRPPDQRIAGIEEQFSHMNLAAAAASAGQEMLKEMGFAPQNPNPPPPVPLPTGLVSTPNISPTENPNRAFYSDDDKSDHGGGRKLPLPPSPPQKLTPIDTPITEPVSRPVYYQDRPSPAAVAAAADPNQSYRGYVMPQMQPEQLQQQQQFIPNPHYIPAPSYYHAIQQPQQSHMYYMPVRPNAPYGLTPMPQDSAAAAVAIPNSMPVAPLPKVPAANLYRTTAAAPAQPLINLAAADQGHAYAGMGYHQLMQQHHQQQQHAAAMANYGYEYADPSHPPPQQVYYTQQTSPPAMAPQYQTMVSGIPDGAVAPQMQPGEVKQTRAL